MNTNTDIASLSSDANRNNFPLMQAFIEQFLNDKNIPSAESANILLACEEILINIIDYAYGEIKGKILVELAFNGNSVIIKFTDDGKPFNPLTSEDPDIELPVEKRNIGGLGIFIVKKLVDNAFYEYTDSKNKLTLVKYINGN